MFLTGHALNSRIFFLPY
ncbi:hypothetical protein YPPY19_0209, partial [Yersinia pestis PY-19]